jgi:hypothetical protein
MPTTTSKNKFSDRDASQNLDGAGGSPNGETAASPASSHKRLSSELRDRLPDELIDDLLAGARSEEEIVGPGGLLAGLTKRLVERAMEVELTDHLGYEHGQPPPGGTGNTRRRQRPLRPSTARCGSIRPVIVTGALSRGSCASASAGLRSLTRRSSRCIRGVSRHATSRPIHSPSEDPSGLCGSSEGVP